MDLEIDHCYFSTWNFFVMECLDSSIPGENNSDNEWIEEENMWDSMETVYNPETGRKRKGRPSYRKIKDVSQRP